MAYDYKNDPFNPDAIPLYNDNILKIWNWFDKVWSCDDWITWHKSMVKKYGNTVANNKWLYRWDDLATGSSAIDCRSFNTAFRNYVKKVGLYNSIYSGLGVIAQPIGAAGDILGNTGNVISNIGSGIEGASKVVKVILPLLLIVGAVFLILYSQKKLKSA